MSNLRKAAQQALEALEDHATQYPHMQKGYTVDAITALRAALTDAYENEAWDAYDAALAESVQEPVAWMIYTEGGTSAYVTDNPNDLVGAYRALALYTAPPQRKKRHISYVCPQCHYSLDEREPLTDEQMRECAQSMDAEPLAEGWIELIKFARAIEKEHGIIP